MFEGFTAFLKRIFKPGQAADESSKDTAKERLHLVLMQDRANVSADFLDLMKQEIIDVIKKYIEVDEKEIDVRLTNQPNEDGTTGAPALYANIPILNIKNDAKAEKMREENEEVSSKVEENVTSEESEIKTDEELKEDEKIDEESDNEEENAEEQDKEDFSEEETTNK